MPPIRGVGDTIALERSSKAMKETANGCLVLIVLFFIGIASLPQCPQHTPTTPQKEVPRAENVPPKRIPTRTIVISEKDKMVRILKPEEKRILDQLDLLYYTRKNAPNTTVWCNRQIKGLNEELQWVRSQLTKWGIQHAPPRMYLFDELF